MTPWLLLLNACTEYNPTKIDTADDNTAKDSGRDGQDDNKHPSDFPDFSPCDFSQFAVSGGNAASTDWTSFCPTVLQDGAYGTKGSLVNQCKSDVDQRSDTMATNAVDIFIKDASLSDLADLATCEFSMTFFFAVYQPLFSDSITVYMWSTFGYHKGEISSSEQADIIAGSMPFPIANIRLSTKKSDLGPFYNSRTMKTSIADANEIPLDENTNSADFSYFSRRGYQLDVNGLKYEPDVVDYTVLPASDMMRDGADEFINYATSVCEPTKAGEWKWCEIYLEGS